MAGSATIGFGGDDGLVVDVRVGDVAVVPAGVGHKRLSASPGFQMAGGYPPGQQGDIVRPKDLADDELTARLAKVALPASDPVIGQAAGIVEIWRSVAAAQPV